MEPVITLVGNIGKIEAQYTPSGKFIAKGTLAVTVGYGDKKETDWYNFVVWEKTGQRFFDWCDKGTKVHIQGKLKLNKWKTETSSGMSADLTVLSFEILAKGKEKEEGAVEDEPDFMRD